MAGIISDAIASSINNAYMANFGRPAEQAGLEYWAGQAGANASLDLSSAIKAGARNDDIKARDDISAGGVNTATTWGNGASLDDPILTYNADKNTWGKIPVAATAAQATQTNWDVTPNQTVKQQAYDIIKDDSLLMQQARSDSNQQMNARGLINSSMAVGAGQKAVLDSAVNIGKQDANTYASSAQANANSANQLSMFNAGESNKLLAASQAQSNLVSNAKLENDFKVQAASDAGFQKQYEMYVDALYKIDQNKDLDAPAKMAMKAQQAQALKSYSAVKGLGLDLNFLDPALAATNPAVNSSSATETSEAKQAKIAKYESDLQAWQEISDWARMGKQAPVNPYPYVAPKYA